MNNIDLSLILEIYYSENSWILNGESYEGLIWLEESEKPKKEEFEKLYLSALEIKNKKLCKETAKQKISFSDWSILPDVKIENKTEFENYRSILRNYILNPVENPVFPVEPDPIWIN
jgi:hypothetical protein